MEKTFTKRLFKTFFTSALALSAVAAPIVASAQDYNAMINDTEIQIDGLSQQQAVLYANLAESYAQIEKLQAEESALLEALSSDDKLIEELNNQIEQLEEVIGKREGLLAEQARAVQVSGGSANYLNYVASSQSVSDLVGRVDVINKMVSANKDLLNVQIADKEAVEEKRQLTEATKTAKLEKVNELEALKVELASQSVSQEAAYNQLADDITLAAEHREALIAEKSAFEEQQRILAEREAQEAAIAAANQAALEASVAAAAQAENEAELQAQYEQALAEAEAQDAAIIAAQEELAAAEQAEAEAEARAQAAEAEAQAAREEANQETIVEEVVEETPALPAEDLSVPTDSELVANEAEANAQAAQEAADQAWLQAQAEAEAEAQAVAEANAQALAEAAAQAQAAAQAARAQAEADRLAREQAQAAAAEAEAARIAQQQAQQEAQAAEQARRAEAERKAAEAEAAAQAARQEAEAAAQAKESAQANVNSLISYAEQFIGTPYVWGGKSPSGFDCSGFVQYVFKNTYGIDVGGWTGAQENSGTRISVSEAQEGDLYFWGNPGSTYHVAIATGGGNYIHASQPGTPLEYNKVSSYFMPSFALRVNTGR